MTHCFAYLRVSGATQADEDRGGIPRQTENVSAFALGHGFTISRTFVESFTGTDLENRPALREMRETLLAGEIKTVVVEKLDRIARDLMIQESIIADFQKHGVTLLSVTPGEEDLCSKDPTRKFIRQVLGAVAEFDRSTIVRRMQDGKRRARAAGKRVGGRYCYGSSEAETELVNRIFYLRKQGMNLTSITRVLNDSGLRTRKGTEFSAMQVRRILLSSPKNTQEKQL